MKRVLVFATVGGIMLVVGFFGGRIYQHATTGYHYKLLEEKEYASELGPIQWSCFLESVGTPFLDPEKTTISMGNRTIYKAQRDFQEDNPHARNIETSGNSITWEDGDYRYHLTVEPTKSDSNRPARQNHSAQDETDSTPLPAGLNRTSSR